MSMCSVLPKCTYIGKLRTSINFQTKIDVHRNAINEVIQRQDTSFVLLFNILSCHGIHIEWQQCYSYSLWRYTVIFLYLQKVLKSSIYVKSFDIRCTCIVELYMRCLLNIPIRDSGKAQVTLTTSHSSFIS